jgi:hypothetical protein
MADVVLWYTVHIALAVVAGNGRPPHEYQS